MYFYYQKLIIIVLSIVLIDSVQVLHSADLILRTRQISNTCYRDQDCPDLAKCIHLDVGTNTCQCQRDYLIESIAGHLQCLKIATNLFDPCIIDNQCQYTMSTDAHCNYHGICQCRENTHFVPSQKKCYASVKLNETCRFTYDCIAENTSCIHGKCICPLNMHPNSEFTNCIKDAKLGEPCDIDEECTPIDSVCRATCRCPVSHITNANRDECLRIAFNLYDPCLENDQCSHISGSFCFIESFNDTGLCACKTGYHRSGSRCWVSVGLNQICESDENCNFIEHSKCVNDRCMCEQNFQPNDNVCSGSLNTKLSKTFSLISILLLVLIFNHTSECSIVII